MWYFFEFPAEPGVEYTVTWYEITVALDGGVSERRMSWSTNATTTTVTTPIFKIDPPSYNCFVFVGGEQVCSGDATDACRAPGAAPSAKLSGTLSSSGSCCGNGSSGGTLGGPGATMDGVSLEMGMGKTQFGKLAGTLILQSALPTNTLPTSASLRLLSQASDTDLVTDVSGAILQVKSYQALAHVETVSTSRFAVHFFPASQIGPKNNGVYPTNGAVAFVKWTVDAPDAGQNNFNRIHVVELRGSTSSTNEYVYTAATKTWTLLSPGALRKEKQWSSWDAENGVLIHFYEVLNPSNDAIVYHAENKFQNVGGLESESARFDLVENRRGTGTGALVTSYQYGSYSGYLEHQTDPNGAWTHYTYSGKLPTSVISGFKNYPYSGNPIDTALSRLRTYSYEPVDWDDDGLAWPATPRTETEYLLDTVVSQTYRVIHKNASGVVDWTKEYRLAAADAALTDPTNLITTNTFVTTGAFAGRLQSVGHPDATMQIYSYTEDATQRVTTVDSGQPNTGGTAITSGTRTISTNTPAGPLLGVVTKDIASGFTLDSRAYSNFDEQGRPTKVTFLDGTFELTSYACCGVDTTTDRDGVTTQYWYDAAKRQVASTRLNITSTNLLDAAGNGLVSKRIGSDLSSITNSQAAYDTAGRMTSGINALNGTTTYSETTDGQGQTVKTTINPDGGQRIETYFKDGQLANVTGTATNPVRYDYDVEQDVASLDYGKAYAKEIKLAANGADTAEWTKTYTDFFGRSYKTIYSDATPATDTDNPYQQSSYNNKGQLWKTRDPDDVRRLFQYNARGELDYTAVDLDRDDVIDFSGTDRITRTLASVYNNGTANVRGTQTYVHTTDGSSASLLISTVEASTDGLRSWQTVYRDASTPVTTQVRTVYAGGGNRYTTNTAPDGSYVLSAYLNGRLTAVTRKTSSGTQLTQTTYGYDAHGRQSTVTDARNGTTTFTFNAADQIVTSTTPAPGTGQPAQATTTAYNTSLQAWKITQPDGTSVTNEFFLTGLLKKTSGSRTYPVEYTYDPQGRMYTMKTWTNFVAGTGAATTLWTNDVYRGWLEKKIYQGETDNTVDYEYKSSGRLWKRHWERGITTTYAYNNAGDLYTVTYSDGVTPSVTYTYDRRGRQKTVVCNGITTTLTFNDANQQLTEGYSGGTLGGLTVTSAYDTLLRRATLSLNTTPSSLSYAYAYDTASRLTNVTEGTYGAGYGYLANSPLVSQITFKQSSTVRLTTTKDYDKLNRLQAISSAPSSTTSLPLTYAYQYNDANQRVRLTLADGSYWTYTYDALGQVVSGKRYWNDHTPVPGQQNEYTFDDIGNRRATKAGGDAGGAALRTASYTPNLLNQYTSRTVPGGFDVIGIAPAGTNVTVNSSAADYRRSEYFQEPITVVNTSVPVWQSVSVTTSGGGSASGNVFVPKTPESFGHDVDGNLTGDGRWDLTWDAENRLTKLESRADAPTGSKRRLELEYDWQGRRIRKKVTNLDTGAVLDHRKFLYDGWNLVTELNWTNNNVIRSYVWGLDLSGSEQGAGGVGGLLLVKPASGNPLFVAYDGNGNVTGLIDATAGTTSAQYEYGPFGETIRMSGTGTVAKDNPVRFSTKYQDDESDLLYYGYRYYSPITGRWMSRDPLGDEAFLAFYSRGNGSRERALLRLEALKPLYEFAGNTPIIVTDSLGLEVLLETHPVAFGFNHSKVTIIPKCQSRWQNDPRFKNKTSDGRVYATIGAGPNYQLYLVSDIDRPNDINRDHNNYSSEISPPNGMTEDPFIDLLFKTDAQYKDNLSYEPFADGPGAYNSNSYVSGFLNAATGSSPSQPPNTPGFQKPVPKQNFQ
ncbi:MAG: hypothetical protein HYY24_17105 [Verrucomicrobia bacterium]|nr:hypothetical protein [Verrucomicrobiota bacterium]